MPMNLAPPLEARRDPDLPAGSARRLEHDDLMPAFAGDARRFEARRPRADDDDLALRPVALRDDMRDRRLAAGRGVVDADGLARIDRVDAIAHADAGADLVLAALGDFPGDMRIGEVGAGHADHVELAALDGVARRRDVLDARRVEGRHPRRGPHLAGKVEMRRGARAHARDDVRERLLGVDMAADDIDEVDQAGGREALGDRDALPRARGRVSQSSSQTMRTPTMKSSPTRLRMARQDLEAEAHAVVERAAIVVVALVGGRRPELVDQVAVAFELEAVEAGGFHPLGAVGIGLDRSARCPSPPSSSGRRGAPARARCEGATHRQPVGLVPAGAPAEMGHLDHHRRAVRVARRPRAP